MLSQRRKLLGCTHIFTLVRAFDQSEGDVLELGTGYFSTLLLHWLCGIAGRKLVSYDNQWRWYKRAKEAWNIGDHEVHFVEDYDTLNLTDRHWGLVLIDHSPHLRRSIDAIKLKDHADFLVLHDTEPTDEGLYNYQEVYPHFKYIYHSKKYIPWTSVISNFKEFKP
jgi:hypothetical protein